MTDIIDFLDDPNDPAPELAMLEELEKSWGIGKYARRRKTALEKLDENKKQATDEEILARFGLKPPTEEPMEMGIPKDEYLARFKEYLIARNWNDLAEMLHTNVDYSFIRTFERMREKYEIKS